MAGLELIGGPFDGAYAEKRDDLREGDHLVVAESVGRRAVYIVKNGRLEYDSEMTFGSGD